MGWCVFDLSVGFRLSPLNCSKDRVKSVLRAPGLLRLTVYWILVAGYEHVIVSERSNNEIPVGFF